MPAGIVDAWKWGMQIASLKETAHRAGHTAASVIGLPDWGAATASTGTKAGICIMVGGNELMLSTA